MDISWNYKMKMEEHLLFHFIFYEIILIFKKVDIENEKTGIRHEVMKNIFL